MSTGIVRAAFCSILTETVDLSDRNTKARDSVRVFLDQITEESSLKKFDEFAASLSSEVEQCVSSCVSAATTCRAKSILREKLWRSFHQLRFKNLVKIWSNFYDALGKKKFDPLVEQQVNQKLFEDVLKTYFQVPSQAASAIAPASAHQSSELDEEEEQIVRYAAGFVPMSLLKKHEKESTDKSVEFVECLTKMAVNGDESSFLSYTLEWSRTVNRGGLFEINDDTYRLFKHIEMRMQNQLRAMLNSPLSLPGKREIIIDSVASDDDVQFLWVLLSCDITEEDDAVYLLKEVIGLWLTIRGFSIAASWMEDYKKKVAATRKTKGLRKSLKQKSDTKNKGAQNNESIGEGMQAHIGEGSTTQTESDEAQSEIETQSEGTGSEDET